MRKSNPLTLVILCCLTIMTVGARPATTPVIALEKLRLSPTGMIQVNATLTQPPAPAGGIIDIEFQYSDGTSTITETVRTNTASVNVARTVTTRQPFPCGKSYEVTATLKNPGASPVRTSAMLSRTCTRTRGTPDLTVISAVRADGGGLQSPRETPIRVRIVIKNVGQNMAFNEMGGTPWTVQVTPGASGSADGGTGGVQTFRIALQAEQEITMDVMPVALPCGKTSPVEILVDRGRVITEASETNNRATFLIAGNRCQDAG